MAGRAAQGGIELPEDAVQVADELAAAVADATQAVPFGAEPLEFLSVLEEEADRAELPEALP